MAKLSVPAIFLAAAVAAEPCNPKEASLETAGAQQEDRYVDTCKVLTEAEGNVSRRKNRMRKLGFADGESTWKCEKGGAATVETNVKPDLNLGSDTLGAEVQQFADLYSEKCASGDTDELPTIVADRTRAFEKQHIEDRSQWTCNNGTAKLETAFEDVSVETAKKDFISACKDYREPLADIESERQATSRDNDCIDHSRWTCYPTFQEVEFHTHIVCEDGRAIQRKREERFR